MKISTSARDGVGGDIASKSGIESSRRDRSRIDDSNAGDASKGANSGYLEDGTVVAVDKIANDPGVAWVVDG